MPLLNLSALKRCKKHSADDIEEEKSEPIVNFDASTQPSSNATALKKVVSLSPTPVPIKNEITHLP